MSNRVLAQRYQLIEPIGRGAMGTVWRATDDVLGRDVAIKEVRLPEGVTEERRAELLQRTMREGRICAGLRHPSVISVHDIIQEDDQPWLVMELVDGRGLDRVVAEDGPLDPRRAAHIGQQLVAALECAHAAGVLHRDVKPANVLVAAKDRVILTDFGIATREGEAKLTITGKLPGAPGYVAPERMQGAKMRPESDLWSLGATLYFAVEGRNPYVRPTAAAQLLAPLREEPDPPSRAGSLAPILAGLLHGDPDRRLRGPELSAALARVAGGGEGSDMSPTTLDLSKMTGPTGPQQAANSQPSIARQMAMPMVGAASNPNAQAAPAAEERMPWRRYVLLLIGGMITLIAAPLLVEYISNTWF